MNRRGYIYINDMQKKMIPIWFYYIGIALALTVLIVQIAFFTVNMANDDDLHSGVVVEKIGQNKPVITYPAMEYGWRPGNKILDPQGWFVLVKNGNRYQRFRLTKQQYDKVDLNASIWRFGQWTFWDNKT